MRTLSATYRHRHRHKRTLFHLLEDLGQAMMSVSERVPLRESRMRNKSKNFDLSSPPSCRAVTRAPRGRDRCSGQVRAQDPLKCERKRPETLTASSVRSMTLLSTAFCGDACREKRLSFLDLT